MEVKTNVVNVEWNDATPFLNAKLISISVYLVTSLIAVIILYMQYTTNNNSYFYRWSVLLICIALCFVYLYNLTLFIMTAILRLRGSSVYLAYGMYEGNYTFDTGVSKLIVVNSIYMNKLRFGYHYALVQTLNRTYVYVV